MTTTQAPRSLTDRGISPVAPAGPSALEGWRSLGGRRLALFAALMLGTFICALDSTVVAAIMPTILADLGSMRLAPWVFGAYMLLQLGTVSIFGKLSDQFGRRRVFVFGLVAFFVGTEIAAFAGTLEQLLVARAVQGVGAGAIVPIVLSSIYVLFPGAMQARLQGAFSGVFGLSSLVGPVLGVGLTSHFGWRAAFQMNAPILALAGYLSWRYFDDAPTSGRSVKVDLAGAATLVVAVVSFSVAVMGWGSGASAAGSVLLLATSLAFTTIFLAVERRAASPIVPPFFLREKRLAIGGNLLTGATMFGGIFFVPIFVRGVLQTSAAVALMPLTLAVIGGTAIAARTSVGIGLRPTAVAGGVLVLAGFALVALLGPGSSALGAIGSMVLLGTGVGVLLVAMVIHMQVGTPLELMGVSSSLATFFRNLGGLVGVNAMAAIQAWRFLAASRDWDAPTLAALQRAGGVKHIGAVLFEGRSEIPARMLATVRDGFREATVLAFVFGALLAALTCVASLGLPRWLPSRDPSRPQAR